MRSPQMKWITSKRSYIKYNSTKTFQMQKKTQLRWVQQSN